MLTQQIFSYLGSGCICGGIIRKLSLYALCLLFLCSGPVFATTQLDTSFGTITVPETAEITAAAEEVKNSTTLSDEDKKAELTFYTAAQKLPERYAQVQQNTADFRIHRNTTDSELKQLEQELYQANKQYKNASPDYSRKDKNSIQQILTELNKEQQATQSSLSQANADFIYLQTLPGRAQAVIAANNDRLSEIEKELSSGQILTDSLKFRLLALESYVLEEESALLQDQLAAQTLLQDAANYRIRIYTLKNNYLSSCIRQAQNRQNTLITEDLFRQQKAAGQQDLQSIPELQEEVAEDKEIAGYIDRQLQDNARMVQEMHDVETALTTVRQIEKSLQSQLDGLSGSLILSRLLNRQQDEIPEVKLSFNPDEMIPNLNLWLYDLRSYRDELFDTEAYVDGLIARKPVLAQYREQLEEIIRHRRALFDQLYQAMSAGMTQAVNLKLKNAELQTITQRVRGVINDHLFWLTSNQPLGKDFLFSFRPLLQEQLAAMADKVRQEGFWQTACRNTGTIIVPLLVLGLILRYFTPALRRRDDALALRLDTGADRFWVTPLALLIRFACIIPRASLYLAAGSAVIYLAISSPGQQLQVLSMLAVHVCVFLFFIDILKPNSLVQRHFCVTLPVIARQRQIVDKIWIAMVLILITANIRDLNPAGTTGDITGYCLMLCCCLYLTFIACKTLQKDFMEHELSFTGWLTRLFFIALPLTLLVMLCLGYYYTIVKVINPLAISIYICMLYTLVSNVIRRELFVAETRVLRNLRLRRLQDMLLSDEDKALQSTDAQQQEQRQKKIDSLRLELINTKAYKLINIVLLCCTGYALYLQWNNMSGVLTYLDTIHLWESSSLVNGAKVITGALSVADVLMALFIVLVTVVLNRNLPPLLERLVLLRRDSARKSTGYTVRIISSYIITALCIIFAAGALGISWDNLQWLVAALSVGLGFGLQEIFANFVSGIIILFERQIRVGDIITINGVSGTVNKIRIRSTSVNSFDDKDVMIPNREFITSTFTNWSLSNSVTMIEFCIGISYDADIDKAKFVLNDIVRNCKYLAPEKPYRIYIKDLADSCINIMCEVFVNEIGNRKSTFDYLSEYTLRRFDEAGIDIPFTRMDIMLRNAEGQTLKIEH